MPKNRLTRRATASHPYSRSGKPTGTVPAPAGSPSPDVVFSVRPRAVGRPAPADPLREHARLTERDHQMIVLLAEHKAMTTDQLGRMFFTSMTTTRDRLLLLTQRGVLARFRAYHPLGSLPWTYTLDLVGAIAHAARTGQDLPLPTQSEITARITRLAYAPSLRHLIGVNEFFTQLAAAARHIPGAGLARWWSESRAAALCNGIVRPDGYGIWTQPATSPHSDRYSHPQPETGSAGAHWTEPDRLDYQPGGGAALAVLGFYFEYDTGTETLSTVLGKLDKYEQLAAAGPSRAVLIQVPSRARESALHRAIRRRYGNSGPRTVPVATTHTITPAPRTAAGYSVIQQGPTTQHRTIRTLARTGVGGPVNPTGPVWWAVGTTQRCRLAALAHPHTSAPDAEEFGRGWRDV